MSIAFPLVLLPVIYRQIEIALILFHELKIRMFLIPEGGGIPGSVPGAVLRWIDSGEPEEMPIPGP